MSNLVDIKEEWYTTKHSNTDLLLRIWNPKDTQPNTVVIFLHGFGEHTGRYLEFFEKFAQNGIKVVSFDQRGHGQTGKKINKIGVGSSTKILFKDIDELIEKYRDATANLVLMGHSYGGLQAFNYAANGSKRNLLDGLIGASPGFIVPPEVLPHPIIVFVLKRLVHILPNFVTRANVDPRHISRDEAEVKKYKEDQLVTDKASLIYANDVINPGSINEDCKKIQVPSVFLVHGTADKVTIPSGSKYIYETMSKSHPNISIKWFEGAYHELHNDLCKDEISNDYITWIRNLKPKLETASKL